MTYDELVKQVANQGCEVGPILPRANWVRLVGEFTPEQLRAIADEVERQYGLSQRYKR